MKNVHVMNKPYKHWIKSIYKTFGKRCQRLKLVSEILELQEKLVIYNKNLVTLKLNLLDERCTTDDYHIVYVQRKERLEKLFDDICNEIADVIFLMMQVTDKDFDECYLLVIKKNYSHIKPMNDNGHEINKNYVFNLLLNKIEYVVNNIDKYNLITGTRYTKEDIIY